MQYIIDHWIEIFGVITGLLFLYFEIKASIWLWPVGILSAIAFILVFYFSKFYADMGLQVYYLFVSAYGWYYWLKGRNTNQQEEVPIVRGSQQLFLILFILTTLLFIGIRYILVEFTDSPLPGWDAFTTALSISATWMLARKIIEQWLIWIVVNFVSLSLYLYKELYLTAFLFAVYGLMAIYGYFEWRKKMRNENHA